VLGVTESRVSQIRTQAILRLRAGLSSVSSIQSVEALLSKRAT